jgi:hypothetical protein
LTELRNEGINRRDFLGLGALGAIVGTVLTIPPAAFVLSPIVKTNILGRSDVSADWQEVGLISEVPENEPKIFYVEFPHNPGLRGPEDPREERCRWGQLYCPGGHLGLMETRDLATRPAGVRWRQIGALHTSRLHGPEERGIHRAGAQGD